MAMERPSAAISLGLRKIPVPIIVPTTIAPAAQPPRPRTRPIVSFGFADDVIATSSALRSGYALSRKDAGKRAHGERHQRPHDDVPRPRERHAKHPHADHRAKAGDETDERSAFVCAAGSMCREGKRRASLHT